MRLRSAYQDFVDRTLGALPGYWARLQYICSLRGEASGEYAHWGLGRTYAPTVAQQAIRDAHRQLFLALLRKPLQSLVEDLDNAPDRERLLAAMKHSNQLLPEELGGGSARHFSTIVSAVSQIVQSRHSHGSAA